MTVTMSSEGDSSKSVLSEANEKSGTDNNTDDSSQDSQDATEVKVTPESIEKKDGVDKPEDEEKTVEDSTEKKALHDTNEQLDKKVLSEEEVDNEEAENKSEKSEKVEKGASEKEKKPVKKEENDNDKNSAKDEESDKEDGEKEVPLLDQPLQKSGKRERKSVQRFNEDFPAEAKEAKFEFVEGRGTALGNIPRVDASISRFKNDDLKTLHRLLFKVSGKSTLIKKNIRKFNGFDFEKDTEDYNKKIAAAQKLDLKQLKSICEMLDLQKTGSKDEVVHRVIEFLLEPKDSGKPLEGGRPKRTAAVKANNRGYSSHDDYSSDEKQSSRARRDKGKRANLKDDTSSDEEFRPNQSDGSDDKARTNKRKRKSQKKRGSSEEEASEASLASSDESDDEPKTKRKRSSVKVNNKSKTPAKKTPGKRGRPPVSVTPAKKNTKRGKKSKTASSEEEGESDHKDDVGSSSEDEPLVKKTKNSQPPTDEEIKTFIKNILEGANLEEITMKTVCQRVYGHYPDFDLTHKKDFIKSTVKSLIST